MATQIKSEALEIDAPCAVDIIVKIAREAERNAKPQEISVGARRYLIYPDKTIKSLEELGDAPARPRAVVNLFEAGSFIDYVRRFMVAGHTRLFGVYNLSESSFSAIIDYHGDTQSKIPAGFGDHQVKLALVKTPEWSAWLEQNKKAMSQSQFAEFIEDNMADIVAPDPATLLDVAQLLQGKKTVQFKSGRNLRNGAIQFEYSESIETTGGAQRRDDSMQVPAEFTLQLVPFGGDVGVEVKARLRYRIANNGELSFHYILDRPHKVIETAFIRTREKIEQETGLNVLIGSASVTPPRTC